MALNKKTQKIGMAVGDVKAGGTIHKYRLVKLSAYNTIVETTSAAVAVGVVLEDYAEGRNRIARVIYFRTNIVFHQLLLDFECCLLVSV